MTDSPVLEIDRVSVRFGGLQAISDFSLALAPAARVAVIGPNGAGKSTLINVISGVIGVQAGEIRFRGQAINGVSAHRRARMGIARTFQQLELFPTMSVLENVISAIESVDWGPTGGWRPNAWRERRSRAHAALALFDLEPYAETLTGALPYGVRKLVELSRALATRPPVLLLDEPVAGLNDPAHFVQILSSALGQNESAVLLIEHEMGTVKTMCDDVCVLDSGRTIARGPYATVTANPEVIAAYLGSSAVNDR